MKLVHMKRLRMITLAMAFLLAAGEMARWWGDPRFVPMAFDELLVATGMIAAVWAQKWIGAAPLAAAWGVFCGVMLSLLVPTLDHLMFGPPKESAGFYAAVLGAMLAVGLWALCRALQLVRASQQGL